MSSSVDLARAAKCVRERIGLSQREVAKAVGISHIYVNSIEHGKNIPSVDVLEKYYVAFGVDLYVYALVFFADQGRVPLSMRTAEIKRDLEWQLDNSVRLLPNEKED